MGDPGGSGSGRKEIYTYEAPWQIYAMGWCQRSDPGDRYRLAVGSFTEEYNNKVQVSCTSFDYIAVCRSFRRLDNVPTCLEVTQVFLH